MRLSAKQLIWKCFLFSCKQNSFLDKRFLTYSRFESENFWNSEMADCPFWGCAWLGTFSNCTVGTALAIRSITLRHLLLLMSQQEAHWFLKQGFFLFHSSHIWKTKTILVNSIIIVHRCTLSRDLDRMIPKETVHNQV